MALSLTQTIMRYGFSLRWAPCSCGAHVVFRKAHFIERTTRGDVAFDVRPPRVFRQSAHCVDQFPDRSSFVTFENMCPDECTSELRRVSGLIDHD